MKEMTIVDAGLKLIEVTNVKTGTRLDMLMTQSKVSITTTSAETQTIKDKLGATLDSQKEEKPGTTVLKFDPI